MSEHDNPSQTADTTDTRPDTPLVWDHLRTVRRQLRVADGLLFGTDFDGTLSPIEEDPEAPEPTAENLRSLRTLRDHPQVRPAVISGRGLADLRERVGIEGVDYVGNHGLELGIDGRRETHPDAAVAEPKIEEICNELGRRLADIEGTVVENKGVTATIHYRMVDREEVETVREHVFDAVAERGDDEVEIHDGKESLELRPAADWDKGSAIAQLQEHVDGWQPLYIGDDTTDEAAFEAITPNGITVHVGDRETVADYRVRSPAEAEVFVRWLVTDGLTLLEREPAA
ncbi:trehalose-phosphatase [Halohasta salina]|uniref:trehalose-phosphatase n=1 Tax=Halohasta salina TaxID=2961621 RepID=UPI0020A25C34|nr:trehalose-phosphatase [Halohasta salina]